MVNFDGSWGWTPNSHSEEWLIYFGARNWRVVEFSFRKGCHPLREIPLTPQKYIFFVNLQNLIQISVVAKYATTGEHSAELINTLRLHGSSGFRTDYQITTKRMMNTIIFTLLSLTGHRWDYLTAKVKRGLSERSFTVSQRLNPENKAAVSAGRASFCSTKSRPPGRRSSKAQSEMAL